MTSPAIFTIGHGVRPIEAFLSLLGTAEVERLVDVRSFPGSRRNPQFGRDALAAALERAGLAYEWARELGGFREPKPGSVHVALSRDGFRGYADHMESPEFRASIEQLIASSRGVRTAVMCAESAWTRCHRRYLSDALVARGCEVVHILDSGPERHRLSPLARVVGTRLVYDVGAAEQVELPTTGA